MTRAAVRPVDLADPVPYWLFGFGLFLLALLLRLACFTGLIASDDLVYSAYAQLIAEGRYTLEYHHFAIRYGLILPAGLLYGLIGVSEWSTIAVPLFTSSLSVVLLALIATRLFGVRAGLIAALLLATFPLQLRYATVLVPEPIVECYVLLALLVYVRTEDWAPMALGALAGALIGVAYLTKEPALFIIPALLIDAALRRRWRQAFGVALGIGAVIALEHAYYLAMTGDLLFRPHAMAAHNRDLTGYKGDIDIILGDLGYRLFKAYPHMMLVPSKDFGIHSLAALVLSAVALLRFRNDRRTYFLLIWASLPWIYLNFGTSSFNQYIPIPVAPRYIDFAYPPLFLLAAWLLADLLSKATWAMRLVLPVMAAVLLIGVACSLSTRGTGYRSTQVAVLRVIADKVEREGLGSVCFDVDPNLRSTWQPALLILSGGDLRECGNGPGRVIVRADQLGFPYVASHQP